MKTKLLSILLFCTVLIGEAQTKRVLLEEFTGALCGNCPMGSYFVDSMKEKYPDLVAVALHAYQPTDAMFVYHLDSLYDSYSAGAPLANIDRIYWGGGWPYVAQPQNTWDGYIQVQLADAPLLTVDVVPSWDAVTRLISAEVNVSILSNMSSGDYRITLYVVEDSVTGSGPGYDQINYYNTIVGNPFFGLGDPIVGFFHRHVVRAVLPYSWGVTGVISSAPSAGQTFSQTIEYTLPDEYDENKVSIVAFVFKFTGNHLEDEVYNVDEKPLLQYPTGEENVSLANFLNLYPNPASDKLNFESGRDMLSEKELSIYNLFGADVLNERFKGTSFIADISHLPEGIYLVHLDEGPQKVLTEKLVILR